MQDVLKLVDILVAACWLQIEGRSKRSLPFFRGVLFFSIGMSLTIPVSSCFQKPMEVNTLCVSKGGRGGAKWGRDIPVVSLASLKMIPLK